MRWFQRNKNEFKGIKSANHVPESNWMPKKKKCFLFLLMKLDQMAKWMGKRKEQWK